MMTTDLGACEWFVWDLRRSNLIDRGQLDQVIGEFLGKNPGAEPPALAEFLVGQGILTEFQAERLLQGKTQGFVLGPFTLMDALGTGSMGTVYKAQSKTDSNWYAVKVLPRRSMWNVRIARRKVRSFEQCQHPSVVPFIDVGTSGGMHYLAWPMVEGTTLDKIVEKEGKLAPEKAALHVMHAAEGLSLCHQEGLFHGLLKPSNLMLSPEGQVKILDFGIGCLLAETEGESLVDTMSTANSVNSGLDCASPESIMDPTNLNAIGDQYSLGCVMYYCLTGRYPFPDGTAVEKMMSHQHKQPTPVKDLAPEVPDQVIAVVERLMQKVPAARYPGCPELIEALKALTTAAAPAQRRPAATMRALPKLDSVRLAAAQQQKLTMAPPAGEPTPPPELPAKPLLPRSPQALPGRPLQPLPARAPSAAANPPAPLAAPRSVPLPRPSLQRPISPAPAAPAAPAPVPMPRPQSQSLAPRRLAPAPVPEPELEPEPQESEMGYEDQYPDEGYASQPTVGQRLGTFGIVLLAVIAGATAWLLTSFIKL